MRLFLLSFFVVSSGFAQTPDLLDSSVVEVNCLKPLEKADQAVEFSAIYVARRYYVAAPNLIYLLQPTGLRSLRSAFTAKNGADVAYAQSKSDAAAAVKDLDDKLSPTNLYGEPDLGFLTLPSTAAGKTFIFSDRVVLRKRPSVRDDARILGAYALNALFEQEVSTVPGSVRGKADRLTISPSLFYPGVLSRADVKMGDCHLEIQPRSVWIEGHARFIGHPEMFQVDEKSLQAAQDYYDAQLASLSLLKKDLADVELVGQKLDARVRAAALDLGIVKINYANIYAALVQATTSSRVKWRSQMQAHKDFIDASNSRIDRDWKEIFQLGNATHLGLSTRRVVASVRAAAEARQTRLGDLSDLLQKDPASFVSSPYFEILKIAKALHFES